MTTWKGQEFEREWHRAMIEWIDGGRLFDKMPIHEFLGSHGWTACIRGDIPSCAESTEYRWKPKPKRTVTINGKVLVAPEVDAPEVDDGYYWIGGDNGLVDRFKWNNDSADKQWLAAGNVFLTREDAQEMADWLVKCRRGET